GARLGYVDDLRAMPLRGAKFRRHTESVLLEEAEMLGHALGPILDAHRHDDHRIGPPGSTPLSWDAGPYDGGRENAALGCDQRCSSSIEAEALRRRTLGQSGRCVFRRASG